MEEEFEPEPKCWKCGAKVSEFLRWSMNGLTVLFCRKCGTVQGVASK